MVAQCKDTNVRGDGCRKDRLNIILLGLSKWNYNCGWNVPFFTFLNMDNNKINGILFTIDKSIINSINNKKSLIIISDDLDNRINSIFNIIKKDYNTINIFLSSDLSNISPRDKYLYNYITYCSKRKIDIDWLSKNRNKFNKKLSDIELFKLIKLKDKLSNETR